MPLHRCIVVLLIAAASACAGNEPQNPISGPLSASAPTGNTPTNTVPANGAPANTDPTPITTPTPNASPTVTPSPVPTPTPDPNNNALNPNHLVNFGKPEPKVTYDPAPHLRLDANQLYPEDDNGYPGCKDPVQVDFGFATVPGCPAQGIGTQLPSDGYCHVNPGVDLAPWEGSNPAASGAHYPDPSHDLGVNITPIARGAYIHSMEHGAVIFAYNCPQGCAYELSVMRQAVAARADRKYKVLMTPDTLLPANSFVAISWTWIYAFNTPDYATLVCFIDQHYNHARENDLQL